MAWLSLEGEAKVLTRHLDISKQLHQDDGLHVVLSVLDDRYVLPAYDVADEACRKYERVRRMYGETMLEYLSQPTVAKAELEVEDPGTMQAEVAFARKLL